MPIYEYECVDCSKRFEVRRGFHDEEEVFCPHCAGEARRMFTPVTVIYKGSGFYTTDYGRGSSTPSKRSNGSESESKPVESKETKKEAVKAESASGASKPANEASGDSK